MNRFLLLICFPFVLLFSDEQPEKNTRIGFATGEKIKYRVHYGFINAAEAYMSIDNDIVEVNGRPCYQIMVEGNSVGLFDFFMRIRDKWVTYIDTTTIIPQKFYRIVEEGNYRKHEIVIFDQENHVANVKKYHFRDEYWRPEEQYDIPEQVQDLVSGYYYLRTIDFSKYEKGHVFVLKVFFEDENIDFKIRYIGIEKVKTKLGTFEAIVLSPIMPENSLFDGENSIRVWLSNDERKIPLKVKASMFVGAIEIDITSYESANGGTIEE